MPRDFRTFAKENENILKKQSDLANEYQNILNKYKNMDNNELISNLFYEAQKLKREGKLDKNTLNSLKSSLSPFLNDDQKNMLNDIVNAINEEK